MRTPRNYAAVAILALLSMGLLSSAPSAQSSASYSARLSTGLARLGEELSILITIENAAGSVDRVPKVTDLEIGPIGSPFHSENISIVGARRVATSSMTWRISVRPLALGEYEIPPIGITVDGERISTKPMPLTVVEDLKGAELGFFDVSVSSGSLVEKMPFELEMLFGWDVGMSGKVDYANLILPWWGNLGELLELESPPSLASRLPRINLNGSDTITVEEIGIRAREGREFRTFRLRRVFLPTRPAELNLSQPFLEFGRQGQRPIFGNGRKKESFFVAGDPIVLSIGNLPNEGQPLDYTGAVGMFDVRADVDTRDVDVGESIKLNVTWSGEGNFMFFDPPQLDRDEAFEEFRVFGSANREKGLDRRTIEFDVAPLKDTIKEIPPVSLSVYDPSKGEFTSIKTSPIRIRVRALENEVLLDDDGEGSGVQTDIEDIQTSALGTSGAGSSMRSPDLLTLGLLSGGVLVSWLALRTQIRRRRGDPNGPLERRRRRARKQLARDLAKASSSKDELKALNDFLAARSRESQVSWVGRDPVEHLTDAFGDTSERLAKVIGRLERGAYASSKNGDEATPESELLELADQLIRSGL